MLDWQVHSRLPAPMHQSCLSSQVAETKRLPRYRAQQRLRRGLKQRDRHCETVDQSRKRPAVTNVIVSKFDTQG